MFTTFNMRLQALLLSIKYLVASLLVIVMDLPDSNCFINKGTTEPFDPKIFPNRVDVKRVLLVMLKESKYFSAINLVIPITLTGLTALSVDIKTKVLVSCANAKSANNFVAKIFSLMAS